MRTGKSLNDIIQGCISAKRESQKEFYEKYYGFLMSISMRYCKSQDDAVEVTNDTFLKVYKGLIHFTPKHENVEGALMGWLKAILINTAIDYCRKNYGKYLNVDIKEAYLIPDESFDGIEDKLSYRELLDIIQQLSPAYRTVFNLYVIDGYKHEEIAKFLKISIGTSKSNLAKARLNLQKMLLESNKKLYEQRAAI